MSEENTRPVKVNQAANQSGDENWVTFTVQMRREQATFLKAMAAREGASPEAMAALLLEEKLAEAVSFQSYFPKTP